MNVSDSTVAIIGTGNIGSTLAANLAAGGQKFLLAGREQEKARELASGLGRLAGKVIIDPTNPIGPDGSGGFRKVIGEQESSGQILAGLLPTGAWLVKAFGTLSATRCPRPPGGSPSARCCSTPRTPTLRVTWSQI